MRPERKAALDRYQHTILRRKRRRLGRFHVAGRGLFASHFIRRDQWDPWPVPLPAERGCINALRRRP